MRSILAAVLVLAAAGPLTAQSSRGLSPVFSRVVSRTDTSVLAWVVARPGTDLAAIAGAISARGGTVRRTSQFVHAVSALVPAGALRSLAALRDVQRVQPVGVYYRRKTEDGRGREASSVLRLPSSVRVPAPGDTLYGPSLWPIAQLRVNELHARGLFGAGVRIAIFDAGFNTLHPFMAGATILAQNDFVYGDTVVRDQPGEAAGEMSHGTATWSLIAANSPRRMFGVAPQAGFLLAKTEYTLTETRVEEDNWVAAVEWAILHGAQIISSSLGYLSFDNGFSYSRPQLNGDIAITTVAADSAAARGVLVVVSGGNSGPANSSIDSPADADSVVAVGAVDSSGTVASFSSRGPTADGRIKPEVLAGGFAVTVARIDSGTVAENGTSFAAPLIAGLAALVQAGRAGPAVQLRDGLLQAGNRFLAPDNISGHGIPDGVKLYAFPRGLTITSPKKGPLATVTPTFAWDADVPPVQAGPNVYFLRVWADSSQHVLLADTFLTSTQLVFPRALPPATHLFWRVVASSTLGVAESTRVEGAAIVPAWTTLLTLGSPQGATIRDSLPQFVWQSPAVAPGIGPYLYDVDVYPASRTPLAAVASARLISDTVFVPATPLEKNLPYRWRVVAHLGLDSQVTTSPGTFLVADGSTPTTTVLFQNFPNPFPNAAASLSQTCIWFDVAQAGEVRLEIFDIRGRLIRRLVPSPTVSGTLPAGRYGRPAGDAPGTCDDRFAWDGTDDAGARVRAGVYVYRLTAPGFRDSRRIVFNGP